MGSSYSSNRTGETKIDTLNSSEIETDPKIAMATTQTDPAVTEEMIDWSNLPSDIVDLVAERVATNLADYMNLLAIFPLWRPVTVDPRHLKFPPQLPWLLLTDTNANPLPFISISDVEPRSLPLPEATGKKILFSSDGWLVMEGSPTKISLLNPLTRRLIHLPPLPPCEDTYDRAMRMLAIAMSSVPTSSWPSSGSRRFQRRRRC
ncbi:putative F-box protein [Cocos nucifera]|uniref:Putative F-box protein n=1 Tax=Cocos nucifera TaxID=13894 RepID=A0A8K0N8F0_COCNU|nr:putative F-box protein [Cocos nucifera]